MALKSVRDVVKKNLCISCGLCVGVSPPGAVEMKENASRGMILPEILDPARFSGKGLEFDACPGKGYPLVKLTEELFAEAPHRDVYLGAWHTAVAARSTDSRFLENASSGGVMPSIAAHLLASGRVQGVVVSRAKYGAPGPRNESYVAASLEEIIVSQGSKYCPVPTLEILPKIPAFDGKLAFIGTPCQIAGLRLYHSMRPELRDKMPFTIGNFCGGFRDLRETDTLIRRSGMRPEEIVSFRYRGGGQPGSMRFHDRAGKVVDLPYPGYGRRTGFVKIKRCRLCVDATAELADFSCGDAWIPRFLSSGKGWSLVITRSKAAQAVIEEMASAGKLEIEEVSIEELKNSQRENLWSKKTRQHARRRFNRLLGKSMPEFDGGYPENTSSLALELKVSLRHTVFSLVERLGLFPLFAKILKRY